ncbi:DNA cytosine methyltransferase [Microbulbifer magnicolonia]|uniref:DNA cytosine methyltransferase n=1 Tax=Microbulbifer magnicolonia TaxID=3109744 RepID=UPI002B4059CB|nr:DNA cytosine methyltransferase [Microbulbifer sp. GG15]
MNALLKEIVPKSKQKRIIERALAEGVNLDNVLIRKGLTYEDLRYTTSDPFLEINGGYKNLSEFRMPFHGVPVVSFFSGCGGLDLGFEAAGFEHALLIEHNEIFCRTLRHNRDWKVIGPPDQQGDVSNRGAISRVLRSNGIDADFPGVFIGGPPCQPFSIAANQRFSKNGENFKRTGFDHEVNGNLLFDFVWYIKKFRPAAFLIENVPGIIELDGGAQISRAYSILQEQGYQINEPLKINAAHYSVPQQRERVFIVGSRFNSKFDAPQRANQIVPCISALQGINPDCPNHQTRKHQAGSVLRYMELDFGKRDQLGRVDRLDPSLPSKTVIAGGTSGGGRSHLHPYIPRTLSVRECARLQTFPDDYEFLGSSARQFTQVGNSVPPVLAAQMAAAIKKSYFPNG